MAFVISLLLQSKHVNQPTPHNTHMQIQSLKVLCAKPLLSEEVCQ